MVSISHDLKAIFIHLPKNGGSSISSILHMHYGFDGIRAYRTDHCAFNEDMPNMRLENFEQIDSTLHKRFVKVHATYNIRRRGIMRYFKQENLNNNKQENLNNNKQENLNNGQKNNAKKKIFYLRKKFSNVDDVAITDEMWNTYFKFVFIRNPYDRVISGWKFSTRGMPIRPKLIDFLRNKNKVTNVAYSHTFITQKAHLIEADDKTIDFDYYGDFNNLNEELIKILLHLGVKTIKHEKIIEKDIIMNKGKEEETKTPYYKYYENQEILDRVNEHFKEDFEYFGYQMYNTIDEIKDNYDKILSVPMTNKGKLNKTLEISLPPPPIIEPEPQSPPPPPVMKPKRGRKKKVVIVEPAPTIDQEPAPDIKPKRGRKKTVVNSEIILCQEINPKEPEIKKEDEELYRINNIKKSNRSLINELKEKKLLEDKDPDEDFTILIDEKNKHIINNVADRLFKKK